jgi:hypothetical protein
VAEHGSRTKTKTARRQGGGSATCKGCGVSVRWMDGAKHRGLPPTWSKTKSGTFCLLCRREQAGEKAVSKAGDSLNREDRAKVRSEAVIEFEVRRDPSRADGEIAKAVRSSVAAVGRARKKIEA